MQVLHLHHLENSRSFRILWLLEELELDYQLSIYERTKVGLAPKQLEQIHPMGKAPILEVDSKPMIESGYIIDYLMAKYDLDHTLHPEVNADSQAWQNYNFWMHFAEASAMPPLVMRLVLSKVVEKSPVLIKPISKGIRSQVEKTMIQGNINKVLQLIENELSEHQWFGGDKFSAVDIQMAFVIEAANAGEGLDVHECADTLNFLKRCQERPAYERAVAKGGRLEF